MCYSKDSCESGGILLVVIFIIPENVLKLDLCLQCDVCLLHLSCERRSIRIITAGINCDHLNYCNSYVIKITNRTN